jgi:predicted nucleic acid-binding Zn ribbon protein
MPVYLFICPNCGVTQQIVAELNEELKAPTCGLCELEMERKFGWGATRFLGSGWAKND